ncbi:MAG: DUF4175 family protein, partial [Pseudomonadota bacterium]
APDGQDGDGQTGQTGQGDLPTQLADRQEALRRALEEAFGQGGEDGEGEDGEGSQGSGEESDEGGGGLGGQSDSLDRRLAEAQDAQRRAEEALRRGDLDGAGLAQREAADALRDAATELAEAADRIRRDADADGGGRDPLGRNVGGADAGYGDDVDVPDQAERQRARDILDELRRRSDDPRVEEDELEYLRRLLRRF